MLNDTLLGVVTVPFVTAWALLFFIVAFAFVVGGRRSYALAPGLVGLVLFVAARIMASNPEGVGIVLRRLEGLL